MPNRLNIEYYSDVLCVFAWIAERRNQELLREFSSKVTLDTRLLDLFSDTQTRIGKGWNDRGGYEGFAAHVRESAQPYEDAPVHPRVWTEVRPATSANAHLVIKAAQLVAGAAKAYDVAARIRAAFFTEAADIGVLGVNLEIAEAENLPKNGIREALEDGRAIAGLLSDVKGGRDHQVVGSPTWVLNQGRQTLYGNVGYRVLHANVEELLKRPAHEASWC